MPASTKTAPDSAYTRYGALKHILEGNIPLPYVLAAAEALQAAQAGQGDQNAQAASDVQATINALAARAAQTTGATPAAAPKPVSAFHLQRSLTRQAAMPAVLDEAWTTDTTRGPADLIRHFVRAAISEFRPEVETFDERSQEIILDVAQFATDTALQLAGVTETWIDEYAALTAYLRQ